MKWRKSKQMLACATMAVVIGACAVQGCGGSKTTTTGREENKGTEAAVETTKDAQEEVLSSMKEFSTADGTVTIKMNEKWSTEDLGVDFWLGAGSSSGEEAILMMQFPKNGTILPADSMDSVKELVNTSYGISDNESTEAPTIPGMINVEASTCSISADGESADAYLVFGETDYAYYSLMYVAEKMGDDQIASMKATCASFVESPLELEDNTTVEITDTVRWFNASYAVLTEVNGWDYNRFAGLAANDQSAELEKQLLDEWWGVTDRASADETLEWILTEGHRAGVAEDGEYLTELGLGDVAEGDRVDFILENFDVTEEEAQAYANEYAMYEEFGADAIAGWDYCRALNLMGYYYLAGYYTETEALDKSLEIAQMVQPMFDSWDELIASYMRGYEYWAEESSEERQAIYEDLKTRSDNPYAVDYHTTLEKTW